MRVSLVLLVVAATLLASTEMVSASPSGLSEVASTRSLKSHERKVTMNDEEREAEERAAREKEIDAKILDNIASDHTYAKQVFRSWLQNGQTKDDIERRLKALGLTDKYGSVVKQYDQYLTVLEERSI